ncbi:hypothetical protein [Pseudobdellovibrio exovorus]|uniref:Methyltransferase domain-containing protein n=1 Tax=Pseudobdellovibrio exovorus JSS TaxID=1184267 RepID=M4VA37_9BACT|nr:hypothetical protein [Pseudobdellovibrio exovorus]AGH96267.1 hypothetical protein A11Q_2051 [Pseudobdellovibrio exovorus JSS]
MAARNGNFVHEELNPKLKSEYLVRQDRVIVDSERVKVHFEGNFYPVLNFSSFGISVKSDIEFVKEQSYDFDLYVDHIKLMKLTAHFVRADENDLGKYSAFSMAETIIDIDTIALVKNVNSLLSDTITQQQNLSQIDEQFKLMTYELRHLVDSLEVKINELQPDAGSADARAVFGKEEVIASLLSNALSEGFNSVYAKMESVFKGKSTDFKKTHFDFFRQMLGEKLYKAPYAHRTFYKPKGYAGDYEMMNIMYSNQIRGESLFAKCLHRYFIDEPASIAVKNREQYLRRKIKEEYKSAIARNGKFKLISIASGPAMEIQNLLQDDSIDFNKVEIHLLDQDLDALKHAQFKILSISKNLNKHVNLKLHNLAIKNVIARGLPTNDFDLIYSAGLFDYFTDPVASFAADQLVKSLDDGGLAIIGNFGIENPNRFGMDMVLDWNLIYRSEEDLHGLFAQHCRTMTVESEEKGINLFANLRK